MPSAHASSSSSRAGSLRSARAAAHRRSGGSTRRSSRATASSLTCTVRVVPSAGPSSSHCPDIQASGNTATTSSLSSDSANSSRSGPLSTPHSSTAAISLAVTRSHRRHVHSSSATSDPGRVPPRSPRSRLTASPWRVLDPHPPGGLDQEPAQLIGIACGGEFVHRWIAVAFGPHRPKLRQPRQPRPGIGCGTLQGGSGGCVMRPQDDRANDMPARPGT